MSTFKPLKLEPKLQELLHTAFGVELEVSGGWGYTQEEATTLTLKEPLTYAQAEHMFATCRAFLEMNMALSEEERYGSINLNEKSREELQENGRLYHKVTFELTAMKESEYKAFIDEYKQNSDNPTFDMNSHFTRRKKATLTSDVMHWFKIEKN